MLLNSGKKESKDKNTNKNNHAGIFYNIKQSMSRLEDTED
jgi:hypothetical protein